MQVGTPFAHQRRHCIYNYLFAPIATSAKDVTVNTFCEKLKNCPFKTNHPVREIKIVFCKVI